MGSASGGAIPHLIQVARLTPDGDRWASRLWVHDLANDDAAETGAKPDGRDLRVDAVVLQA